MALYAHITRAQVISLHVCHYDFSHIDIMHDQGAYKVAKRHYSMFLFFGNEITKFAPLTVHCKCKSLFLLEPANAQR